MKIVIIGTGNTATVLGRLIKERGHSILQVFGRNKEEADRLASELQTAAVYQLMDINQTAELYILAVSDTAIASLADKLRLQKGILVHTAGSVSKEILKNSSTNYGVLYPLQSLRKEGRDIPFIPFLVDGNSEDEITLLQDFARSLSTQVQRANDDQRLHLHLGAIIVNNFPNYLYAKAADYCNDYKVDFRLLLPLIRQTTARLTEQPPKETQTGPAVRGDIRTIQRHMDMLLKYPEMRVLYDLFTRQIQDYFIQK